MGEARRYSRLPFRTDSRLFDPASRRLHATYLVDISLKGALVGRRLRLEVRLADSPLAIRMETEVAHCDEGRLGLHCVAIDLDSMTHLRRLMELNLGDPALLERELFSLG